MVREKNKPRLDKKPGNLFYGWQDDDLDYERRFPWGDVYVSKYIGPSIPFEPNYGIQPCPKCVAEGELESSDNLVWVYFRSPDWTWRKMCGREGYLSICTKHKRQVDFICTRMN